MHSSQPLSVIISTYNRSDALLATLKAFAQQTDRNFEVVVADDGSRDEHRRAVLDAPVSKDLGLTHVWHPDVGFTVAKARNRGVAASKYDYLVFVDGDCLPEVDFIAQHKKLAQVGCMVNGSRVLLSPGLTQRVVDGIEQAWGRSAWYWVSRRLRGECNKLTHLLRLSDGPRRLERGFRWKGIRGCNMGVWRADYERVDGYDESFTGWGHEDADVVLRLHHAGIARKNGFCATEVFHLWHKEAARGQESVNAQVVRDRILSGQVRATAGYSQVRHPDDLVITRLGS
ncbi:glycosyltransferase family 2 protein [Leptospira sp. 96542]|nr:glycosyltransferase family 2 protein [Leptospira sp. 96542]